MWYEGLDDIDIIVDGKTREERIEEQRQYYENIKNIKRNGNWWQKFRLWCILGDEYDRY